MKIKQRFYCHNISDDVDNWIGEIIVINSYIYCIYIHLFLYKFIFIYFIDILMTSTTLQFVFTDGLPLIIVSIYCSFALKVGT